MSKYSTVTIVGKANSGKSSMIAAYIKKFPEDEDLKYDIHDNTWLPIVRDKRETYKKIVTLEKFPHE